MVDIFISYSKTDRVLAENLAGFLKGCGYQVWWDATLGLADRFDEEIEAHLAEARAVIVIWTDNSARSDNVLAVALQAKRKDKLIPTRVASLRPHEHLPFDFRMLQTELVTDQERILRALRAKGVVPSGPGHTRASSPPGPSLAESAEQHWLSIKDSQEPAEFDAFLRSYPQGSLAELARKKRADLEKATAARRDAMQGAEEALQGEDALQDRAAEREPMRRRQDAAGARPESAAPASPSPQVVVELPALASAKQPDPSTPDGALAIEAGRLAYQVPERMWLGVQETVEVRLGDLVAKQFTQGFVGSGSVKIEDVPIVETMSVSLVCQPGAFDIEPRSEKDQLVKRELVKGTAFHQDDFARWIWLVTPRQRGKHTLFVKVSAAIRDSRGLPTTSSLPDKVIAVTVHVHLMRAAAGVVLWAAPLIASGIVTALVGVFTKDYWWPAARTWLGW